MSEQTETELKACPLKPPRKRIVTSYPCDQTNHRGDFESCPHCNFKMSCDYWDCQACILVLGVVFGRHSAVAVVSECTQCFEKSWVHHNLLGFRIASPFPPKWIEAVKKEYDSRTREAEKEWKNSLCLNCSKLKEVKVSTIAYRECKIGLGPVTNNCQHFTSKNL